MRLHSQYGDLGSSWVVVGVIHDSPMYDKMPKMSREMQESRSIRKQGALYAADKDSPGGQGVNANRQGGTIEECRYP